MIVALGLFPFADAQERKLLPTKGWGSLSGKVTLDGAIPPVEDFTPLINKSDDKPCCIKAPMDQKVSQRWIVDEKTKAVMNVAVWIKPPAGSYFPIEEKDKVRKETVTIDQPFCAFLPHAVALYPSYFDGKKQVPTGQKLVVKNSAKCPHNIRGTTQLKFNRAFNSNMPPGSELEFVFTPQPLPIIFNCDFHKWMDAYVFVFEHPYFALTKKDGTFTIPRVPAGAEVTIMAYHEGVYLEALAIEGKQITLKEGANTFDFSFKAPK